MERLTFTGFVLGLAFALLPAVSASAQSSEETQLVAEHAWDHEVLEKVQLFHERRGVFPSSNRELGIGNPESFANEVIASVELHDGGEVVFTFTEKSGVPGGKVHFEPVLRRRWFWMWLCKTSDYERLPRLSPLCVFDPGLKR